MTERDDREGERDEKFSGGDNNHEPVEQHVVAIKNRLKAISDRHNAAVASQSEHDKKTLRINRATFWVVAFYAALTLGILITNIYQLRGLQDSSRQTERAVIAANISANAAREQASVMAQEQRAWLSPEEVRTEAPIRVGTPIQIEIIYENTGRTPAFSFNYSGSAGALLIPNGFSDWNDISIPERHPCDNLAPLPTGPVIYPSSHFGRDIEYRRHASEKGQ